MRYSLMIRGRKVAQQYSRFFDHALYIRGYQFASADRFLGVLWLQLVFLSE